MLDLLCILGQPDGAKMTPAEFPDYGVAAVAESVSELHGVVSALDVIFHILLVFGHEGTCVYRGHAGGGRRTRIESYCEGLKANNKCRVDRVAVFMRSGAGCT